MKRKHSARQWKK